MYTSDHYSNKLMLKHQVSVQKKKKKVNFQVKAMVLVIAMVFPIVMYGCESWTIKKAEH